MLDREKSDDSEMDGLIIHEEPLGKFPTMIAVFGGWPDASESATNAVRFLIRELDAPKFAEIDPEQFFDFTTTRPRVKLTEGGDRELIWPANDFHYFSDEDSSRSLILFVGTEPNLRWRSFCQIVLTIASRFGVRTIVSLGALNDAVPHTRETQITGRASSSPLTQKIEWLGVGNSKYEGPTSIHTALMEASIDSGVDHASLWGHCPHYLNISPNPKVSQALINKTMLLTEFDIDTSGLEKASDAFGIKVSDITDKQSDVKKYVRALEQEYDTSHNPSGEIPSPEAMVQELEDFLKSQSPEST